MSVQTLYTAATGMQALETKLDVIANNLANVNTTGFKRGRANFEDLFYRHQVLPGAEDDGGGRTATGTSVGLGARVTSIQTDFKQGAFQQTNNMLDVAIEGPGFFQVRDANGDTLYTRSGNFSVNAEGNVVLGSASMGRLLEPNIQIPRMLATKSPSSPNGNVLVRQAGDTALTEVGRIQMAAFINPEGLLKTRRKPVQGDRGFGSRHDGQSRRPRLGPAPTERSGSLQRGTRPGTDRPDHHPAILRAEFPSRAGRRPDPAARREFEAVLNVVSGLLLIVELFGRIFIRPLSPRTHGCQHRTTARFSLRSSGGEGRVRGYSCFPGPLTLTLSPPVL